MFRYKELRLRDSEKGKKLIQKNYLQLKIKKLKENSKKKNKWISF